MNILSNRRGRFVTNAVLILLSVFMLNCFLNYKNYTLYENGNWTSTKAGLRGLFGSVATVFTKNVLSQNHLNIGSWFGYQELIYNRFLKANEIRFSHFNKTSFSFLLNKIDSITCGIYFKDDSAGCLFMADNEGKFISSFRFNIPPKYINTKWNDVIVKRNADSILLKINDHDCLHAAFSTTEIVHLGFRGDRFDKLIDDVVVYNAQGEKIMSEDFAPPFVFNNWTWLFVIFSLLTTYLLFRYSYYSVATAWNMSLFMGISISFWVYFNTLSNKYETNQGEISWHEVRTTIETENEVVERIRTEYPVKEWVDKKPVILFIGTSQTWGAGVSTPQKAYPALVEKNLQYYFQDTTITVINVGISGSNSTVLYTYYDSVWYKYHPLLTVIDLSTNDRDTTVFKRNIQHFLTLNKSYQIATLLIAEPNSYTLPFLLNNHRLLKAEGNRFGVKTLELQTYLDSCQETGFLWWDAFHCTDYGYHLVADRITPEIVSKIEQDSLLLKFRADKGP